jgi:hypothetical protein
MTMRAYLLLTTVLFTVIALVHLLRFAFGWTAVVGTWTVPLSVSLIAIVICVLLAFWGMNLMRRL